MSTQRSWERGGCRPSPPPRGRCGGRGLALPWVTPRWEGPCPPPPHSQLCLQNFRVSRPFAHHPNVLFLVSKRFSLSHQQAGPAHGREESRDGFVRGARLIPPTTASVEEHISIRWGPAVQFLGGPPASLCMPVTLSWAWQEIQEGRGLVGWRRSAATVSLRNMCGFEEEVRSLLWACWFSLSIYRGPGPWWWPQPSELLASRGGEE